MKEEEVMPTTVFNNKGAAVVNVFVYGGYIYFYPSSLTLGEMHTYTQKHKPNIRAMNKETEPSGNMHQAL